MARRQAGRQASQPHAARQHGDAAAAEGGHRWAKRLKERRVWGGRGAAAAQGAGRQRSPTQGGSGCPTSRTVGARPAAGVAAGRRRSRWTAAGCPRAPCRRWRCGLSGWAGQGTSPPTAPTPAHSDGRTPTNGQAHRHTAKAHTNGHNNGAGLAKRGRKRRHTRAPSPSVAAMRTCSALPTQSRVGGVCQARSPHALPTRTSARLSSSRWHCRAASSNLLSASSAFTYLTPAQTPQRSRGRRYNGSSQEHAHAGQRTCGCGYLRAWPLHTREKLVCWVV
jgi:hypothetical protein